MIINSGGKFTDIRRGFIKLLQSYKSIRKLLQKLTKKKMHHVNEIQSLIKEIRLKNNAKEREIRHYAQLQLVSQVEQMLKGYIYKSELRVRKYDVYSHVVCYLNVLIGKVLEFVPKNIAICQLTPQLMKWKLFLSQLNQIKQAVGLWVRDPNGNKWKVRLSEKSPLYKLANISEHLTKTQTPSTAYMSLNQSSRVLNAQPQEKNQIKRYSYLKRCQTAKPFSKPASPKKQYPINIRSPSAKQYLKSSKKGQTAVNTVIKKFSRKAGKKKLFVKIQPQNKFESSIQIIQLKQSLHLSNHEKSHHKIGKQEEDGKMITFGQQNKENLEELQDKQDLFQKKWQTMIVSKRKDSTQRRSSIRKIKQNMNQTQVFKSSFAKDIVGVRHLTDDEQDQEPSGRELGERTKLNNKRGKNLKVNSIVGDIETQQVKPLERKRKQKKSVYFQILKQALSLPIKNIVSDDKSQSSQQQAQPQPKKSTRRKGIISSKDIAAHIVQKVDSRLRQEELEMQLKTKEFNEKLIEEMTHEKDAEDVEEEIIQKEQPGKDMGLFYKELSKIREQHKRAMEKSPLAGESTFFAKQDLLREEKSRQLQQYIRKLKIKNKTVGEVFQIRCEQTNVKVQNYMMMERKYAFDADSEWIKTKMKMGDPNAIDEEQTQVQLMQFWKPQSQKGLRKQQI